MYSVPVQVPLIDGESWATDCHLSFNVDRCPSVFIPFFDLSGAWDPAFANPRALQSWWADVGTTEDLPHDDLTYTGVWTDPYPFVAIPNTTPDQFDQLQWRFDQAYGAGFRRIILQLPGGVAFGMPEIAYINGTPTTHYIGFNQSVNQWWAMPQWKRSEFMNLNSRLKAWKVAHSDVNFEIYTGFGLPDNACSLATKPNSFAGAAPFIAPVPVQVCSDQGCAILLKNRWVTPASTMHIARDFDPRNGSHIGYIETALIPWAVQCTLKVKTFWMDAAAIDFPLSNPDPRNRKLYGFNELTNMPTLRARGMKFGGEAIPLDPTNELDYNACAVHRGPWMALGQYFSFRDAGVSTTRFERWFFDPYGSEIHYLPESPAYETMANLIAARSHGMVITLLNLDPTMVRRVQRLYSMGSIEVADVDCNGHVDGDDILAWLGVLANAGARPFSTVATGDLNEDGEVNSLDEQLFTDAYAAATLPGGHWIRDYHAPNCE